MLGEGDVGLAVGFEKMRDAEGEKMDGKLIGKVLGLYSHSDERPGKTFVSRTSSPRSSRPTWTSGARPRRISRRSPSPRTNAREDPSRDAETR